MNTLKRSSSLDEGLPPSRKRLRLSLDHRSGDPVSSLGSRNVRVVARVRPLSKNEEDKKEVIAIMPPSSILVGNEGRNYEYDSVFGQDSSQSQVYEESGAKQAVCQDILQGFNCTILAYGQTGSGKTFTMGTAACTDSDDESESGKPQKMDGIIPRAVYDLFKTIGKDTNRIITVDMSFLEIYNEEARDLLSEQQGESNLYIRENSEGGVYVQNLTWKQVSSASGVAELMNEAASRRVVASTQMNAVSSRSHAICTLKLIISTVDHAGNKNDIQSKLTLVDLAGSERVKRTRAEGDRLKEGININKGLFVLGQVVSCLSEIGQQTSTSSMHVPYRDSKLTRLLQDSLGGNSRTIMVACVSPADSNTEESINTLRYASRARNIQNSAVKNIVETLMPPAVATALRRENQSLRQRVIQLESLLRDKEGGGCPTEAKRAAVPTTHMQTGKSESNFNLVSNLRTKISSLECKVEHLNGQVRVSSQDALESSLRADKANLLLEEITGLAEARDIVLPSSSQCTSHSFPLVKKLRGELSDLKAREAEARVDTEIARATAATVIRIGEGDLSTVEDFILQQGTDDLNRKRIDEDMTSKEEVLIAKELLAVNGSIEKKEEIVKKALLEKKCIEDLRSHFEGALQNLQSEVETLSKERGDLMAIVDSIPGSKASTIQMRNRIKLLETRMSELRSKASDHKKSLRLREIAEKKVTKLETEIRHDKKRKADLQKRLKEESAERKKDKMTAKTQAARLMKDSQRLKYELHKVKAAADKQAMVLRRKTTELLNKQKRQHAAEQRKRKRNVPNQQHSASATMSGERKLEILSWVDNEIRASSDILATDKQITEQEFMLEESLRKLKENQSDETATRSMQNDVETRRLILDQLKANLKVMKECSFKDKSSWKGMSKSDMTIALTSVLEKLVTLRNDSNHKRQKEMLSGAIAATKAEERNLYEESILKMRLDHSEAMSNLLDSTRMALENEIKQKVSNSSVTSGFDKMLNTYFAGADRAASSIKTEINELKSHRDYVKHAVESVAKGIIAPKSKKKAKRKQSVEETLFLDESDLDDGNDSDWSPEDEKPKKRKKVVLSDIPKKENLNANKENLFVDEGVKQICTKKSLDSLTVSELKDCLRGYGLRLSGKKAELKVRLSEYLRLEKKQSPLAPKKPVVKRKPLQAIEENVNLSFMQDNTSFSAKRRDILRRRRRIEMSDAVHTAMMELANI